MGGFFIIIRLSPIIFYTLGAGMPSPACGLLSLQGSLLLRLETLTVNFTINIVKIINFYMIQASEEFFGNFSK